MEVANRLGPLASFKLREQEIGPKAFMITIAEYFMVGLGRRLGWGIRIARGELGVSGAPSIDAEGKMCFEGAKQRTSKREAGSKGREQAGARHGQS